MKDRAVIKIKLKDHASLRKTLSVYSQAVNYAINICWKKYKSYTKLYYACYRILRSKYPQLPAQLIVTAIKKASECCSRARTKPVFNGSIRYNPPRSFSIKNDLLSISTIEGRVKIPIEIPEYFSKYAGWNATESELFMRGSKLYFHLGVAKEANIDIRSVKSIVGVDLGINRIAVTSEKQFFKGIKHHIYKFISLRRRLKSKGTKSAKKHLKALSGRQKRFTRNMNHIISRKIVENAKVKTLFVLEDLTGIRKKNRGKKLNESINNWSRFQLRNFIEYKAISKGHIIATVTAYYTSKTCSKCGEFGNRKKGFFHCPNCGYSCNSDLNASHNLMRRAKPLAIALGLSVSQPIVANNEGNDLHTNFNPEFSDKPLNSSSGS